MIDLLSVILFLLTLGFMFFITRNPPSSLTLTPPNASHEHSHKVIRTVNDFCKWRDRALAMNFASYDIIVDPSLQLKDLTNFLHNFVVVEAPSNSPTQPWKLVLRIKNSEKEGPCTCETPWCILEEGKRHVPVGE